MDRNHIEQPDFITFALEDGSAAMLQEDIKVMQNKLSNIELHKDNEISKNQNIRKDECGAQIR
jgi:hypothetical protein